jgi:gamma-glutamyltranspeptidase/glutathione hydrolase
MTDFTTRPDIRGHFGVVASTHWIASAVGFGILEKGGNAFDAAVATGLVLQVVEPHLNGPGGDMPALIFDAATGQTQVVCGQGTAPEAATLDQFRNLGLDLVPGSGLLATVVPGAFDAWMILLRDFGTLPLRDVLAPAIDYAERGHPVLPRVSHTIAGLADFFSEHWPSSASVWMPDGAAPEPHTVFHNPDLARTYTRMVSEAETAGPDRVTQIDAARQIWKTGFVADAIADFLSDAEVMDVTEKRHKALLSREDIANWSASYEPPQSAEYHGWTVHKTPCWGQGPVMLQSLAILKGFDIGAMDPMGAPFVHLVIEAMKLAYADREAYYGDPNYADVPIDHLLSEDYAQMRRALITDTASQDQRPGRVPGFEHLADACIARSQRRLPVQTGASAGEPTMSHLTEKRGDTVHLDVIDRWGNMVSATPSGGWLQSSPVVPGLGFALNTRAQMFWLEDGLASSLRPGARPRTTLSPSMAEKDGTRIAFGTPGGDQQDQWQLIWFLRIVHFGMGLQACMDAPLFHSMHFQGSFYPRQAQPGAMMIEASFDPEVIADLRARGHIVEVAEPWTVGRMTAALRDATGQLQAAATPRLMQAYAVGR